MKKLRYSGTIPLGFNYKKHLYYFSNMKAFFDVSHLNPEEGDELLLQVAIETTKMYGQKIKVSLDEDNSALAFFVKYFLEPGGQFYYDEEAKNGFVSLINVLEEILEYIRSYVPETKLTLDKIDEYNDNAEQEIEMVNKLLL